MQQTVLETLTIKVVGMNEAYLFAISTSSWQESTNAFCVVKSETIKQKVKHHGSIDISQKSAAKQAEASDLNDLPNSIPKTGEGTKRSVPREDH